MKISIENNKISIDSNSIKISDLIEYLSIEYQLKITGLEHRKKNKIALSIQKAPIEKALQLILKQIGETSYAFEYKGNKLYRVSVVPELKNDIIISVVKENIPVQTDEQIQNLKRNIFETEHNPNLEPGNELSPQYHVFRNAHYNIKKESDNDEESKTAVKVLRVVEDSQAFEIGLAVGDIVIEYNGLDIESAKELVSEVNTAKELETVSLMIIRDDEFLDFDLQGGQIGISIQTITLND